MKCSKTKRTHALPASAYPAAGAAACSARAARSGSSAAALSRHPTASTSAALVSSLETSCKSRGWAREKKHGERSSQTTTHQLPPLLAAVAARHDHFQRGVVARQRFHRRADRFAAPALQHELGAGGTGDAGHGGVRDVLHLLNAHVQLVAHGVERERLLRRRDAVHAHVEWRRALQRVL